MTVMNCLNNTRASQVKEQEEERYSFQVSSYCKSKESIRWNCNHMLYKINFLRLEKHFCLLSSGDLWIHWEKKKVRESSGSINATRSWRHNNISFLSKRKTVCSSYLAQIGSFKSLKLQCSVVVHDNLCWNICFWRETTNLHCKIIIFSLEE